MPPFHMLLVLFAILSLVALAMLIRWERRKFIQLGKGGAWLAVRITTIPVALATAALVIIPARSTSGMEGLAVFYILLITAAPIFWFGGHWLVGKFSRPPLSFKETAQIAGSPLLLGFVIAWIAPILQSAAWFLLRLTGLA
jgi:hypothetical protein